MAGGALLTAAATLIGVAIGYTVWSSGGGPSTSGASSETPFGRSAAPAAPGRSSSAAGSPSNLAAIAAKVDPALVDINTVLGYQTAQAAGTGMVLTATGEVLTNNHVIEGATSISVTDIGNGKTYSARVLGYDRSQDVAVIQLTGASGLQTVSVGNSSNVSVGQAVVGIGNAGGAGGTPSTAGGSITALNQSITASDQSSSTVEHLTGLIETNAHIQPGDSGGPLVDTSSQVIGMDTAASAAQGFTFRGADTGQGYSIPINTAIGIAKQITSGKTSSTVHIGQTAFLGVGVQPTAPALGTASGPGRIGGGLGFRPGFTVTPTVTQTANGASSTDGAAVVEVVPGSPAQNAGLVRGDVITGLGGTTVTSPNSLTTAIGRYHPGDSVKVQWTNTSGQQQTATVQLAKGPAA